MTDTLPGAITTVHSYDLPLGPGDVWEQISAVEHYRAWWPWLRRFDAGALAAGEEWQCEVQPPLPYVVRFQVVIDTVEPPVMVRARVLGDVAGDATLELAACDAGCKATLYSSLAPGNSALRMVSRFAAPLARFGHDWVLDSGARQFITRAASSRPGG